MKLSSCKFGKNVEQAVSLFLRLLETSGGGEQSHSLFYINQPFSTLLFPTA